MQILKIYFDAVVVFVTSQTLLFRLALAILCQGHIGWATSMPFASINSTNPRTNPWNFHKKYWELEILKNSVFWVGHFEIFLFQKKNLYILVYHLYKVCSITWNFRQTQNKTEKTKLFSIYGSNSIIPWFFCIFTPFEVLQKSRLNFEILTLIFVLL